MGRTRKRKTPAARPKRGKAKCKHTGRAVAILGVDVEAYACRKCGAVGVRPMGRSKDSTPEVQVEIRAAELDAWYVVDDLSASQEDGWSDSEVDGWRAHCDPSDLVGDPAMVQAIRHRFDAGWLACEMTLHEVRDEVDPDAWPWDPTRPVAGQYEEWLDAQAEREEARAAANTAVLVADLDAKGAAYHALNDAFDAEDYDPQGEFPDSLSTDCPDCDLLAEQDGDVLPPACSTHALDAPEYELTREADADRLVEEFNQPVGVGHVNAVLATVGPLMPAEKAEQIREQIAEQAETITADDYDRAWDEHHPPIVVGRTVAALANDIVEAGGTLPYRFAPDASAAPAGPAIDSMEYELTRDAEPDCRDEDGPEVERIMAEMEREPRPTAKRIPTLDETLDRWDNVMRGLAEADSKERDRG